MIFKDVINLKNEFYKITCIVVLITIGVIIIIAMIYNITYNSNRKHKLDINTKKFHKFLKKGIQNRDNYILFVMIWIGLMRMY